MKITMGILLAILLNASAANCQTDFSGNWKFKSQESISGNLYANGSPNQMSVAQKVMSINIKDITDFGTGNYDTTFETLNFNGSQFATKTASKRKKLVSLKWNADKTSFTVTTNTYDLSDSSKLFHTVTDVWALESGNLMLQRKNQNFSNGEVWESKAFYQK